MIAEQSFQNIDSAQDGRSNGSVGGHLQHRRLGQDASIGTLRRKRSAFETSSLQIVDAIVPGQSFVEKGVVGIDDIRRRPVVDDQVGKVKLSFL